MPGDGTQTDLAVMEQTAGRFDAAAQELQVMLQSLRQKVAQVQAVWVGQGANSFQQVMAEWSQDQDNISRLLGETAQLIRSAGREYGARDTDAASGFGAKTGGPA